MAYKVYHIRHKSDKKVVYVGITKGYLSRRFASHLKDKRRNIKKVNYFLAHKKDLEIVSIYDDLQSLQLANEMEVYEIKRLKKSGIRLLNKTDGGDGTKGLVSWNKGKKCEYVDKIIKSSPRLKPVFCYDLQGNFIKEYRSIKFASIETGCTRAVIANGANQKTRYKQSKGFQWRFFKAENIEAVFYDEDLRISKMRATKLSKSKKVTLENITTGEVFVFENITDCSIKTGLKYETIYASIRLNRLCQKKYKIQYS